MVITPKVDLVGVGLNATDTVLSLPEFPTLGSKIEYSHSTVLPGGQVASAIVACQNWGLSTRYVGKLGDDSAADLHTRAFAEAGVEAQIVTVSNSHSPQSLILVDPNGERTVLVRRDERLTLQPEELQRDWIANARALLVDGQDTAAATRAAHWAREAGVPVIADLDLQFPGIDNLLINIDYLIVSRDFPTRLMNEPDLEEALKKMHHRYGNTLSAATLGPDGVLAYDGKDFTYRPAYRVHAVDTTGAGDIFHAGFIYGLLQKWPLDQQLDFACAAAAVNCTAVGARGAIHSRQAIDDLIAADVRYPSQRFSSVTA